MKKIIIFLMVFSIFVLPQFVYAEEDIYDVILFWGQSNMVGYVGGRNVSNTDNIHMCGTNSDKFEYEYVDENLTSLGASTFAQKTGILPAIVAKYTSLGHVDVPVLTDTVYEYSMLENKLKAITKDTEYLGERIYVHADDPNNILFNGTATGGHISLHESQGTNMIPWYGKTHYETTKHKVIAVFCGNGGEELNHFLAHKDDAEDDSIQYTNDVQYIQEAMISKYKSAIQYLESKNYKIGHKFDVVLQGETDARVYSENSKWDEKYTNIHNKLKSELGLDFSVVVESGRSNGDNYSAGAVLIHNAQEKVIRNNDDVIAGSDFAYKNYVGNADSYSGKYKGQTMSHEDAVTQANLSTAKQCKNGSGSANTVHFHAAALSQIGYETALKVNEYLESLKPVEEKPDEEPLVIEGPFLKKLKVGDQEVDVTDGKKVYELSVPSNQNAVKLEGTLVDERLSFVTGYGPRTVSLDYGLNKIYLKIQYNTEQVIYEIDVMRPEQSDEPVLIPDTFMGTSILCTIIGIMMIVGGVYMIQGVNHKKSVDK